MMSWFKLIAWDTKKDDIIFSIKFLSVLVGALYLFYKFELYGGLLFNVVLAIYSLLKSIEIIGRSQFYIPVIFLFPTIYIFNLNLTHSMIMIVFFALVLIVSILAKLLSLANERAEMQTEDSKIKKEYTTLEFSHYEQDRPIVDFEVAKSKAFSAPLFYIGEYIPKYTNQQDEFSQLILLFKNYSTLSPKAKKDFIDYFAEEIVSIVKKNSLKPDIVIPIPSSEAFTISDGHKDLSRRLAEMLGIEDGTNALIRIKTVRKSSTALPGERPSFEEHYRTMIVNTAFNLKGKKVLLFDDVYTKGNTARAAATRIFEAGAEDVWIMTLGKTKRWY